MRAVSKHASLRACIHTRRSCLPTCILLATQVNRREWEELHTRLNGGVPLPREQQLTYFFGDAAKWCEPSAGAKRKA